jgi:hypothetical protein
MCRNVRSIEWHQKTYHEISWDYPFKKNARKEHVRLAWHFSFEKLSIVWLAQWGSNCLSKVWQYILPTFFCGWWATNFFPGFVAPIRKILWEKNHQKYNRKPMYCTEHNMKQQGYIIKKTRELFPYIILIDLQNLFVLCFTSLSWRQEAQFFVSISCYLQ